MLQSETPPLRLAALALAATLAGAGPGWADVPRCMAMAHVWTAALNATYTMESGETIDVQRIEQTKAGTALCGENHSCWPAADFDLVTPCTIGTMQGRTIEVK